jgi:flavodoxin
MEALVVYATVFGNTEEIAKALAGAISVEARAIRVGDASPLELGGLDLLIVGSPTQGGRPVKAIQEFIGSIPENALRGVSVTAFDTRHKSLLTRALGYAAGRVSDKLKGKGGTLVASPEGFWVEGLKGPVKEGELERAAAWAREVVESKG